MSDKALHAMPAVSRRSVTTGALLVAALAGGRRFMKIQAKDCGSGGAFRMEGEGATPITYEHEVAARTRGGGSPRPDLRGAPLGTRPRALAPGESFRTIVDSSDAAGNHVMITENAAGVYTQPDGVCGSVASVTIRTFIPGSGLGASGYCITSTVLGTATTPGWTAAVKKPGGCDKEVSVELSNSATRQKAVFSYLYIAGRTRIDYGAVR